MRPGFFYFQEGEMKIVKADFVEIADTELVFDVEETKLIMKFFWPTFADDIDKATITNFTRSAVQSTLIAAIDASYQMGFVDSLYSAFGMKRMADFKKLAKTIKKLTIKFVRQWWKHATEKDLQNVKIYEAVRVTVAARRAEIVREVKSEIGMSRKQARNPVYISISDSDHQIWS